MSMPSGVAIGTGVEAGWSAAGEAWARPAPSRDVVSASAAVAASVAGRRDKRGDMGTPVIVGLGQARIRYVRKARFGP
ncbi:hypothetical protein GCM10009657_16830 [Oryzihumus leptocrescens]